MAQAVESEQYSTGENVTLDAAQHSTVQCCKVIGEPTSGKKRHFYRSGRRTEARGSRGRLEPRPNVL